MKKHTLLSDIAVFLLIVFLFIIPPFFASSISAARPLFSGWGFPWYQLLLAFLGAVLLFFYYEKNDKRTLIVFPVLFTFGMLFSISLICRFLSEVLNGNDGLSSEMVVRPAGFVFLMHCMGRLPKRRFSVLRGFYVKQRDFCALLLHIFIWAGFLF